MRNHAQTKQVVIGHDTYPVPQGYKLHLHHLHPHNSDRTSRKGGVYRTVAQLVNRESGEVACEADAVCGKRDVPTRERGRQIAIGRVLDKFSVPTFFSFLGRA